MTILPLLSFFLQELETRDSIIFGVILAETVAKWSIAKVRLVITQQIFMKA